MKGRLGISLFIILSLTLSVDSQSSPDNSSMQALKASLGDPSALMWFDPNPCNWSHVICWNNRVTRIQISSLNLKGSLPPDLKNLTSLIVLEVAKNQLTGPIPSLAGLSSLQRVLFNNNSFSYIPSDFFTGLTSLQSISLDYNPFSSWEIPESFKDATGLQNFSANGANVSGSIPEFFGGDTFPGLKNFHLAINNLQGQIPLSFSKSSLQTLWLNDQNSLYKLNGSIAVLQNMTFLTQLWLHKNSFTGPLPDLSGLIDLQDLSLRENLFTGIVPLSLLNLPKLTIVNLTLNYLQGPTPKFNNSKVHVDMVNGTNRFCLDNPGVACNSWVNILLSIVESVGYPLVLADSWKGNDPCDTDLRWKGIICDNGNITGITFQNLELSGTISPNFSMLTSLKQLILSNNSLTGTIPNELTTLPSLEVLDVSNNRLYGEVPKFRDNVSVYTDGNPKIVKDNGTTIPSPGAPPSPDDKGKSIPSDRGKNSNAGIIVGSVIGAICGVLIVIVALGVCMYTRKRKSSGLEQSANTVVIHLSDDGDANEVKNTESRWSFSTRSEFENMLNSIEVLRNATFNFSEENILGRGGFGTVYKGELPDGTEIAVKRMQSGVLIEKGLAEFKSEIEVLTKVRHRHLLALLGYCLDQNERLLVYEFMPQGTLSRHLFNWKEEGWKPLDWNTRFSIALDVARGVEYLHGLAHQSFIHRDLKPSNILLGNDMRAKVADFGLVRLVPEYGKNSIETRVAGTFGYLAPECVVTGRVTTKVDVFSFGVILMELITGQKAIDTARPEHMLHLVPWLRSMHNNKDTFRKAIDETIELDEETLANISKVFELAYHCCTNEPYQRPDMGHVVYVLSSLVELWRPAAEPISDDINEIEFDIICSSPKTDYFTSSSAPPLVKAEALHHGAPFFPQ